MDLDEMQKEINAQVVKKNKHTVCRTEKKKTDAGVSDMAPIIARSHDQFVLATN
jgi:hypothetical protein